MKPVKYLLVEADKKLLRKFKISKEIQIRILKVQANANIKTLQKLPRTSAAQSVVSPKKFKTTNHVNYGNRQTNRFKCHLCPYSSANKHELKRHLRRHSAHRQFNCDKCSYTTNTKSSLQCHTSSKHNKNPESRKRIYPCQLCSRSFFTITASRVHLSVHTKEKPFSCQFCSRTFAANSNKNRHEIICSQNPNRSDCVWVENQKRFQCKLCDKRFMIKSELTVHIRQHTQEKPYQCETCKYAATSSGVLKLHVDRRHNLNRIKNFACKFCLKMFFTKAELYQHIHTHTHETLSACRFCKKPFVYLGNRNRHETICKLNPKQSDEEWVCKQKKFKCQLCDYSSTEKFSLQNHMICHTGNAPFKCTFCQFGSTKQGNLSRHLKTHIHKKS